MDRQTLRQYNSHIERFIAQLDTGYHVREADVNSLLVALALAYNASLPTSPIEEQTLRDYYIQNHHRSFERAVDYINENLVLYHDLTLRLAEKLFFTRYALLHNPSSFSTMTLALQVSSQDQVEISSFHQAVMGNLLNYNERKMLNIGCAMLSEAVGREFSDDAEMQAEQ